MLLEQKAIVIYVALATSASALTSTDQLGPIRNDSALTPALRVTAVQDCYGARPDHVPLDGIACQKTFGEIFTAPQLDVPVRWGPHFYWAHWQAPGTDCAVYLHSRDYSKGRDVFRLRDIVNAAIRITQTCESGRHGYGGRATVGNLDYFYVEIYALRLDSLPGLSTAASNSTSRPSAHIKSTRSTLQSLSGNLASSGRGVQCRQPGQTHLISSQCALSARLIPLERDYRTYRRRGPCYVPRTWLARGTGCAITLRAQDPIDGTDTFTLSAVYNRATEVLSHCEKSGFGGTIQVGTRNRFIVSVEASTSGTPVDSEVTQLNSSMSFSNDRSS